MRIDYVLFLLYVYRFIDVLTEGYHCLDKARTINYAFSFEIVLFTRFDKQCNWQILTYGITVDMYFSLSVNLNSVIVSLNPSINPINSNHSS